VLCHCRSHRPDRVCGDYGLEHDVAEDCPGQTRSCFLARYRGHRAMKARARGDGHCARRAASCGPAVPAGLPRSTGDASDFALTANGEAVTPPPELFPGLASWNVARGQGSSLSRRAGCLPSTMPTNGGWML
jgi:hypothetical protein